MYYNLEVRVTGLWTLQLNIYVHNNDTSIHAATYYHRIQLNARAKPILRTSLMFKL